jgi:hypothetical protein
MTLLAILKIISVILVQCSSILQNSSVILKILSAILLNDYRGLAGVEGRSWLGREALGGRVAHARVRNSVVRGGGSVARAQSRASGGALVGARGPGG